MVTPPEVPIPGIDGGGKAKAMPVRIGCQLPLQMALNVLELLLFGFALIPWLERHEEEAGVGALHLREEGEIVDGDDALYAIGFEQRISDLLLRKIGTLGRCGIRQLQGEEHIALVFRGDKAAGKTRAEKDTKRRNQQRPTMAMADLWMSTSEV